MSFYDVERQFYLDRLGWAVDDSSYSLPDLIEAWEQRVDQKNIDPKLIGGGSGSFIDVTTLGAIGDGVTDDTAALTNAKNAANAAGLPVYLPKGTYMTTGITLDVPNQEWTLAKNAVIKLINATTRFGIVTISANDVYFHGGKIDGNQANQTYVWEYGISVQSNNVVVSNVEITACFSGGISLETGSTGGLVTQNYCHNNGKSSNASNGILMSGCNRTRVIANRCEDNGVYGTGDQTYDGNGIHMYGMGADVSNLVANNQCSHNARRGIKIQEYGFTVVGNLLVGNSAGIGVTDTVSPYSTPGLISGNMIKSSFLQGLQLDYCHHITITGNTITDSGDHGVGAYGGVGDAANIVFTGNTVVRSGRHGMNLNGSSNWIISGNQFIDNGQKGVERAGVCLTSDIATVKQIAIIGNISHNTGTLTTQNYGFILGTADKVNMVGNMAINGVGIPYSTGSATNYTTTGNI